MTENSIPSRPRPATYDHLRKKEPIERRVKVVMSDSPLEAIQDAQTRLLTATDEKRPEIEAELQAAQNDLVEATVVLRFRSMGRRAWDELINAHPPTQEQVKEAKDADQPVPIWNFDTFLPAAIVASCVEPKMTIEEFQELYDEWGSAEVQPLWMATLEVNTTRRNPDLGKGFGPTTV